MHICRGIGAFGVRLVHLAWDSGIWRRDWCIWRGIGAFGVALTGHRNFLTSLNEIEHWVVASTLRVVLKYRQTAVSTCRHNGTNVYRCIDAIVDNALQTGLA